MVPSVDAFPREPQILRDGRAIIAGLASGGGIQEAFQNIPEDGRTGPGETGDFFMKIKQISLDARRCRQDQRSAPGSARVVKHRIDLPAVAMDPRMAPGPCRISVEMACPAVPENDGSRRRRTPVVPEFKLHFVNKKHEKIVAGSRGPIDERGRHFLAHADGINA